MDVLVSSRNERVTREVEETAQRKIGQLDRLVEDMERAEVHFYEERNPRIADKDWCEVTMAGHGHHIRAKASASDPSAAIDATVSKLEKQLRKLKTKLSKQRHRTKHRPGPAEPPPADLTEDSSDDDSSLADQAYVTNAGQEVVKRKSFSDAPMSIDDAIGRMDLLGHDFFVFTDVKTDTVSVLYRRDYGGLGLIEHRAAEDPT